MRPRWAVHFSGNAFQWEHCQKVREVSFYAFSLKLSPGEGKRKGMEGQGKRGGYPTPFRFSGYTHVVNITWLQAGTDKNSQSVPQPYNSKYRSSHFVHMVQRLSMHSFAIMHAEMRVLQLILYTYAKSNCSGLDKVTFIISPPCDNNISNTIIYALKIFLQMLVHTFGCSCLVFVTSH